MQQCCLYLQLKSNTFTLPVRFRHMMDFSLDILNSLISNANHTYTVKSEVRTEVFQSFVDYLINDTTPDITIENINEYIDLSNEFEILSPIIEEKKSEFGEYLIHINSLRYHRNTNLNDHEIQIAQQLDSYIEQYGSSLMKIPIQSLYNIFNHPSRKLTKFDAAYEEIKKEFSNSKDSSIFILLESLDGSKMTRSNLEEIISLRYQRNNHMVRLDFDFISNLQKKQIESEKKVIFLENQIEQLRSLIDNKFDKEIHSFEIKIKQEIDSKLNEKVENLKSNEKVEFEKFTNEFNKKLSEENQQLKNENNQMKIEILKIKKDCDSSIQKLLDENKQIKNVNEKLKNEIEQTKKDMENLMKRNESTIKNMKDENEKLKNEIEQTKKDVENLMKGNESTIKNMKDENEKLKKRIVKNNQNSLKSTKSQKITLLFEKNKEFQGIINYLISKGNIDNEINITSSPLFGSESTDSTKHAILYNSTKYFRTSDAVDSFICFDFKEKRINPTAYTIKTASYDENNNCIRPRSWVIEVSNNGSSYAVIDEQNNCSLLNGYSITHTFNIKNKLSDKFRYIKLRQTGINWYGNDEECTYCRNILVICCIEFYGYLE